MVTLLLVRIATILSLPRPDNLRKTLAVGATGQSLRNNCKLVPLVVVTNLQDAVPPLPMLAQKFGVVPPSLTWQAEIEVRTPRLQPQLLASVPTPVRVTVGPPVNPPRNTRTVLLSGCLNS